MTPNNAAQERADRIKARRIAAGQPPHRPAPEPPMDHPATAFADLMAIASNKPLGQERLLTDAEVRNEQRIEHIAETRAAERAGAWAR